MSIVETVKRICLDAAKALPSAEVIAPMAVWDATSPSMGAQIKSQQDRAGQKCEVTASFVLSHADLTHEYRIRFKAISAVTAMLEDIQVQIRPVKAREQVA